MHDRDALLARVDLATLADGLLGPRRGTARAPTWPCPNPSHAQTGRTPPVSVFRARTGDQRWTCHGCGYGGTAIDLVMAVRHVGIREAMDVLATQANMTPLHSADEAEPRSPGPPRREQFAALDDYVRACARRLWQPSGRTVREWLTTTRGVPADVLELNHIGADPGPVLQRRPDGVPRRAGAVFPVIEDGRATFAQLRRLDPRPGQPRYLSVANRLVPNPGYARYHPATPVGGPVVVTEGPVDGLAAAAAGYEAAALFGVGVAGATVARRLAGLGPELVLALDGDDAGRAGADRLATLLRAEGRRPVTLGVPPEVGDLAAWMTSVPDWPSTFAAVVERAQLACSITGPGLA